MNIGVGFFLKLSLLWGCVSSFFVLILVKAGVLSASVYALKDGVIYFLFIFLLRFWYRDRRFSFALFSFFLLVSYCFVNYAIINPDYVAVFTNVRQLVAPLLLLIIFFGYMSYKNDSVDLNKFLFWVLFFVFCFGAFDQFFRFFESLGLSEYFNLKGLPVDEHAVSYMFYEPALNYARRMVSFLLDPISLGHLYATSILYIYYTAENKKKVVFSKYFILPLFGLLLTFSKGAMLQLFLGMVVFNRGLDPILRFLALVFPFLFVSFLPYEINKGILIHFEGTVNSFETISFFGYGIGSAGNYAKMFSDNLILYYELGISDTYVGSILGQVGFFGLLLWLFSSFFIIWIYSKTYESFYASVSMFLSILIVSIMSENTMNVTSFIVPAVLIAACGRNDRVKI